MLLLGAPVVERDGMRLLLSPSGAQTMSALDGGATGRYYDWGELVGYQRPNARHVVLLGLGGGEMLRAVRRSLPRAELAGIDIDPGVAQTAVREFGVDELGVHVLVGDALTWAASAPAGAADVLLVDVFDDMVLPGKFREPAFFRDCLRIVGPKGAVLMNVWPADLSRRVAKAMRRGGFDAVTAIDVTHGNTLLWAGPLEDRPAPAWMRLSERYTP